MVIIGPEYAGPGLLAGAVGGGSIGVFRAEHRVGVRARCIFRTSRMSFLFSTPLVRPHPSAY
jgi:hypothetical protein